ncbi:MAG TPA: hypothetical protein VFR24_00020 [Candidatus Angelobacter sp.]|nr:hypothetical protein [Candidatus Angelobacter sp.]
MRTVLQSMKEIVLLCGIIGFSVVASAQCKFTTLNIPGEISSFATGINDQGAIVGTFSPTFGSSGFLLFRGSFTHFSFPGATTTETEAEDINNVGQIVGDYFNSTGQHGFVVHNGAFHSISDPAAPSQTQALSINNFGTIVGSAGVFGFRLSRGHFTTIRFPGSTHTVAAGINDFGVIVGTYINNGDHGFMLKNGTYTAINFPGADGTSVSRINNEGDIVGTYHIHGDLHGFSLDKGRFLTHDDPSGMTTIIIGVNKFDTMVGAFVDNTGHEHSFRASCVGVF